MLPSPIPIDPPFPASPSFHLFTGRPPAIGSDYSWGFTFHSSDHLSSWPSASPICFLDKLLCNPLPLKLNTACLIHHILSGAPTFCKSLRKMCAIQGTSRGSIWPVVPAPCSQSESNQTDQMKRACVGAVVKFFGEGQFLTLEAYPSLMISFKNPLSYIAYTYIFILQKNKSTSRGREKKAGNPPENLPQQLNQL